MILVRISEPFHRPGLKPGRYVTIDLCTQVDFCGGTVDENTPFHPLISYTPIDITELQKYLMGLHHMSKVTGKDAELTYEASSAVLALLPEGVRVQ